MVAKIEALTPMPYRQSVGKKGEDLAAIFLQTKGFSIITKNWRCPLGEIDLIVERDGEIRFVEVKTRASRVYGFPEEAVTAKKLRHLARSAEVWLRGRQEARYQMDVVSIFLRPSAPPQVIWIEGV